MHPWIGRDCGSRWCSALVTGLVLMVLAPVAAPEGLPETIERVGPAVVVVGTHARLRQPAGDFRGTGFAVADGRHVITNAHVLSEALDDGERLGVFTGRGQQAQFRAAEIVARDPEHDLALLRIAGDPLPALELGDADGVRAGERYAFTGYPIGTVLGLYPVTHEALVSSITPIAIPQGRAERLDPSVIRRLEDPYPVFQLDATAYPGNSGSPLYDPATGAVVGVVNMVFVKETKENVLSDPSGIAYAIPIRHARALIERARER